ncbi:MAG: rhodanese-like domain-containing protein [Patescibacteria group bacterium]|jgi:rhodanese-related sulfurtransferase
MDLSAQDLVAEAKREVPAISCTDYLALRAKGEPHTLIDVREQDEWGAGHIEGAIHIPRGLLEFKIPESIPDKQTPIIVQCATGGRSALCGQTLLKMGYTNIRNLEGGYTEYRTVSQR